MRKLQIATIAVQVAVAAWGAWMFRDWHRLIRQAGLLQDQMEKDHARLVRNVIQAEHDMRVGIAQDLHRAKYGNEDTVGPPEGRAWAPRSMSIQSDYMPPGRAAQQARQEERLREPE
jgi:hypothetical protein